MDSFIWSASGVVAQAELWHGDNWKEILMYLLDSLFLTGVGVGFLAKPMARYIHLRDKFLCPRLDGGRSLSRPAFVLYSTCGLSFLVAGAVSSPVVAPVALLAFTWLVDFTVTDDSLDCCGQAQFIEQGTVR